MKTVLSIAGSDPSGGAGIEADLKTIEAHRLYGMSVITAVTAQNTLAVRGVHAVPPKFVAEQIDCVCEDIPPDAVKLGMLYGADTIAAVAERLRLYGARNIVLDPVMLSTSGRALLAPDAVRALVDALLPLCDVVTPNLAEAAALCGHPVETREQMVSAAKEISVKTPGAVLVKGGHLTDCADDLLYYNGAIQWLAAPRIDNPNTHGTGCTLSSAIACGLASGRSIPASVQSAKRYLTACIRAGLDLGQGAGPLCHHIEWED